MRFALAGELSTALTHELNQPITALVSYLRRSRSWPLRSGSVTRASTTLSSRRTREALRASDILKRLRDFYRGGVVNVSVVDVEALFEEVLSASRIAQPV